MLRAVLLAAGMGTRLASASGGIAKALVTVRGAPLVLHQLNTLRAAGFAESELVVVGGFQHDEVAAIVSREAPGATIVENRQYRHQNLLSLLAAREHLHGGFLLVNVDHLMPPAIHRKAVADARPVVACVDHDRPLGHDDMKVACDDNGDLRAISKQLTVFDRGYVGMTRVLGAAVPGYLAAADAVLAEIGPERAVVEMILGRLATTGRPPALCDISGHRWAEVDTPDELAAAEDLLARTPGFFDRP